MNEIQKAIYTMLKQVHPMTVRQVFYQLVRHGNHRQDGSRV